MHSAGQYVEKLMARELQPSKRLEIISNLRVALTSNSMSWLSEFGPSGLNAILHNLNSIYNQLVGQSSVNTACTHLMIQVLS